MSTYMIPADVEAQLDALATAASLSAAALRSPSPGAYGAADLLGDDYAYPVGGLDALGNLVLGVAWTELDES